MGFLGERIHWSGDCVVILAGLLRSHIAIWSAVSGDLMQRCSAFPTLAAACRDVLDSYFQASIPHLEHLAYLMRLTMPGAADKFKQTNPQHVDCPAPCCPPDCLARQSATCRDHADLDDNDRPACDNCQAIAVAVDHTCPAHNPVALQQRVIEVLLRKNYHQHSMVRVLNC